MFLANKTRYTTPLTHKHWSSPTRELLNDVRSLSLSLSLSIPFCLAFSFNICWPEYVAKVCEWWKCSCWPIVLIIIRESQLPANPSLLNQPSWVAGDTSPANHFTPSTRLASVPVNTYFDDHHALQHIPALSNNYVDADVDAIMPLSGPVVVCRTDCAISWWSVKWSHSAHFQLY